MSITTEPILPSPPEPMGLPVPPADQPMDVETVHSRSMTGIKTLSLRAVLSLVLRIISTVVLSRLLVSGDYGDFALASQISGLGVFLADFGMNGKLLHQPEEPSDDQSSTVFWLQQGSTTLFIAGVLCAMPLIVRTYHMNPLEAGLLVAMTFSLYLFSLRVVPLLLLERRLMYNRIAEAEAAEQMSGVFANIVFALLGAGAWSLGLGNFARGAVGLTYIWRVGKWKPRGRFRLSLVFPMIRFGLPFQLNALAPMLLGTYVSLYLRKELGRDDFGLVNWAINISSIPLMFSQQLSRVAFPAFSRLQGDENALQDSTLKAIRQLIFVLSPIVPLTIFIMPLAIRIVFGSKWEAAIPLVQWFTIDVGLQTITGLLAAMQNASGRPTERLIVAILIGGVRIAATYYAVVHYGVYGTGPAWVGTSLLELLIMTVLVSRHNFSSLILLPLLFRPLLETSAITLTVILLFRLNILSIYVQTLGMITLLCVLLALRDLMTPAKPLLSAVAYLYNMVTRIVNRLTSRS